MRTCSFLQKVLQFVSKHNSSEDESEEEDQNIILLKMNRRKNQMMDLMILLDRKKAFRTVVCYLNSTPLTGSHGTKLLR